MRRPAALLFLLPVLVAGLSAIPVTGASAGDPQFRTGVDLVPLDVCARDPSGRLIPNLSADDFLILENGVPQSVSFIAAPEAVPLHAVLLIDISSSMYGEKLNHAVEAGAAFAGQLRSDDRLEVLAFDQRALPIHRFDEEPTGAALTIGASVRSAVGNGSAARTALYDALLIATHDLERARRDSSGPTREVIVVVSDGDDTASHIGFEELLPLVRRSGVLVYTVSLRANDRGEWLGASWPLLQLAVDTGARALSTPALAHVTQLYRDISEEVRHMYRLAYVSKDARRDGGWRSISVRLVAAQGRAITRSGYYAPRSVK